MHHLDANVCADSRASYINYAYGDEDPATIYGESLGRLQKLKARYDPEGRFNQWFPIP